MVERKTTIELAEGLHARPAARFVELAQSFASDVWIARASGGPEADAKDVIGVLALDLSAEEEVDIGADGSDDEEAVQTLAEFLEGKRS